MSRRALLALPLLALAIAGLWRLSRPAPGVLCVAVREGRVLLETASGSLEVPAGEAAAGGRATAPVLLAAAFAAEGAPEPSGWEAPPEPAWRAALRGKLSKAVRFRFDGIPFRDAREYLQTQGGVVIDVDRLAQEAQPALDETPLHLTSPEGGMRLESALSFLVKQVNLRWALRDERIVITTEAGTAEPPVRRAYDVAGLLGEPADFKPTPAGLRDFIREYVDPSVWSDGGGALTCEGGKLFVTAPRATHARVLDVLRGMRAFQGAKPPIHFEVPEEPAWKKEISARLAKPIQLKLDGVPFREALEHLQTQGGVVINVDRRAREGRGDLDDSPIRLTSPEGGMSLESALQALTREVRLAWTLRDESITITTEAGLLEPPELRQYDVRDLIRSGLSDEKLVGLLKESCDKALWGLEGYSLTCVNGAIYAAAQPATHAKLREVLGELRK